jgi:hypothetical protein
MRIHRIARSKKYRGLICLLALLLIALCFLYSQFSLTAIASIGHLSLTNNMTGEELEPLYIFKSDEQTFEQTFHLYLFEGYLIWVSSRYWPSPPTTITVEPKNKSDDRVVTITVSGYLAADGIVFPLQDPETRNHDHQDIKNFVIPPDFDRRIFQVSAQRIPVSWS